MKIITLTAINIDCVATGTQDHASLESISTEEGRSLLISSVRLLDPDDCLLRLWARKSPVFSREMSSSNSAFSEKSVDCLFPGSS